MQLKNNSFGIFVHFYTPPTTYIHLNLIIFAHMKFLWTSFGQPSHHFLVTLLRT